MNALYRFAREMSLRQVRLPMISAVGRLAARSILFSTVAERQRSFCIGYARFRSQSATVEFSPGKPDK